MIERDIIKNSQYIIEYYKKNGKKITNLELQKLAYFLEAIYMCVTEDVKLYNEDFSAWNFGPVNDILYNKYKEFGSGPIELEEEIEIHPENESFIKILFNLFHDFTAAELVNLSHKKGSPWHKMYISYNGNIPHGAMISKIETKKWFHSLVKID